jgi:hypothetical protein
MSVIKTQKTYKGTIRVDVVTKKIYVSAAFRKACSNIASDEYELLQRVREGNPNFTVEERKIKTNPNKESYRGLTYGYMERYIALHDGEESKTMKEYKELRLIAECHSISFPKIRDWFLEKYPDVKNFSVENLNTEQEVQTVVEGANNDSRLAA